MPVPRSDGLSQSIWGAAALTASFAGDANKRQLDVWGYNGVLFTVRVTKLGKNMTRIDVAPQVRRGPAAAWSPYPWEATTVAAPDAVTALTNRQWQKDITGLVEPFEYAFYVPTLGDRFMQIEARAGVGDPGGSEVEIFATRVLDSGMQG